MEEITALLVQLDAKIKAQSHGTADAYNTDKKTTVREMRTAVGLLLRK